MIAVCFSLKMKVLTRDRFSASLSQVLFYLFISKIFLILICSADYAEPCLPSRSYKHWFLEWSNDAIYRVVPFDHNLTRINIKGGIWSGFHFFHLTNMVELHTREYKYFSILLIIKKATECKVWSNNHVQWSLNSLCYPQSQIYSCCDLCIVTSAHLKLSPSGSPSLLREENIWH